MCMTITNKTISVGLTGARGKMGREVARTLSKTKDLNLLLAVDIRDNGKSLQTTAGSQVPDILVEEDLTAALTRQKVDVLVEFSHPTTATHHTLIALKNRIPVVIGTSGVSPQEIGLIRESCKKYDTPTLLVPNFAISAVLGMKFAEMAAMWMPQAEIIEFHHDQKADAPSGTAYRTAEVIANARREIYEHPVNEMIKVRGVRGGAVEGIPIHSVRIQGVMAHQDIIFGSPGETLTIRHDVINRGAYMEGVKLAIRRVQELKGLVIGLDALLF